MILRLAIAAQTQSVFTKNLHPWLRLPESFERNEISESEKRVINIVSAVQNRRTVRIVDRELDDDIRHFNLCAAWKMNRHRPSDGDPVHDS